MPEWKDIKKQPLDRSVWPAHDRSPHGQIQTGETCQSRDRMVKSGPGVGVRV